MTGCFEGLEVLSMNEMFECDSFALNETFSKVVEGSTSIDKDCSIKLEDQYCYPMLIDIVKTPPLQQ